MALFFECMLLCAHKVLDRGRHCQRRLLSPTAFGVPSGAMRTGSVLLFVGLLGYAVACGGEELVGGQMAFPIRVCSICSEEFELRPEKPGFASLPDL